jgi:predicted HicB family RNase H-like nuclease
MKHGETDETKQVNFRAPASLVEKAKADAKRLDLSMSQLIRSKLRECGK